MKFSLKESRAPGFIKSAPVLHMKRDPMMETTLKSAPVLLKAKDLKLGEDGKFEGYLSTWDTVDWYGESFARGAWTESIERWKADDLPLPLLWQHDSREPIGAWTDLEEDDKGLRGTGQVLVKAGPLERRAWEHIKAGSLPGLSVGYFLEEYISNLETGEFSITKADLRECSCVTFAANREAKIDTVKAMELDIRRNMRDGESLTERQMEFVLREQFGFSRRAAEAFMKGGFKSQRREAGNDDEEFKGLTIPSVSIPSFD